MFHLHITSNLKSSCCETTIDLNISETDGTDGTPNTSRSVSPCEQSRTDSPVTWLVPTDRRSSWPGTHGHAIPRTPMQNLALLPFNFRNAQRHDSPRHRRTSTEKTLIIVEEDD